VKRRRALVFNSSTDKDTLSLLLPLSTVAWDAVFVVSIDWQLTPRTSPLSLDAAVAHCIRRKQLAEDAVAVSELEAGTAAAAAAAADGVALTAALPGIVDVPPSLAWQATQLELFARLHVGPRFTATRHRLAAALTAPRGHSDASLPTLPALPEVCRVAANFSAASAAIRGMASAAAGEEWHVLVTGSLYLAGSALQEVGWSTLTSAP